VESSTIITETRRRLLDSSFYTVRRYVATVMHSEGCGAAPGGRIALSLRMGRGCPRQLLSVDLLQTSNDDGQEAVHPGNNIR
jgi:hypothetical protein